MTLKPPPLFSLAALPLLLALAADTRVLQAQDAGKIQKGEMAGYLLVPNAKVPESYSAGFSLYVAAWPWLDQYPGQRFQTGLFGTWMAARNEAPPPIKLYSDVEGGLGWWQDTEFGTETPKFIMGGVEASGTIEPEGAILHEFSGKGGATWKFYPDGVPKEQRVSLAWNAFATPLAADANTFGYRWDSNVVKQTDSKNGRLVKLPEYFHLVNSGGKPQWLPVPAEEVPVETGLTKARFDRPRGQRPEPYVTPEDAASCWKKPGPKAGPFQAHLGDGSVVTYYWYRFADQPAVLNADFTDQEREAVQARVEKLHRHWKKDRDYLPPPAIGTLAELDPALLATPPPGRVADPKTLYPMAPEKGKKTKVPAKEKRAMNRIFLLNFIGLS